MQEDGQISYEENPPRSIVAYFNKAVFSDSFYALKESSKLNELLMKSARGIMITGYTREVIAGKMERMARKTGLKRIIALLDILHIISISNELEYISSEGWTEKPTHIMTDRLSEVYAYIDEHFRKDISLKEIAGIACLTPSSFCRVFKSRTSKHFVEYLNEVRVSRACKYLQETDLAVTEVAFQCGFKTISNFNKFFKKTTGHSPKDYRHAAGV